MAHTPSPLVFIDSQVPAYGQLIEELGGRVRFQVIEPQEEGVAAIAARLRQDPANTVVIVAHGAPGQLLLGRSVLGLDTLNGHADLLQTWFVAAHNPQLHLYGCEVAAGDAGAEFLARLHALTGAGIAASPRLVGHADLGGDWQLDRQIGRTTTPALVSPSFVERYRATLGANNFADATVWSPTTNTGTTAGATHETGEPIHDPIISSNGSLTQAQKESLNNSIWWQWTAPITGSVTADTLGSALTNTVLAVYTGGAVNSLNQVGLNDNISSTEFRSSVTFNAVQGVTYYFAVDGSGTQTGGVQLNINTAPQIAPNQSFSVLEGATAGTTLGTLSANETGLTWTLRSGNPDNDSDGNRAFSLSAAGVLTVNDPGDLNFEVFPTTYNLVVRATDSGGLFSERTVSVRVLDAPDQPVITSLTTSQSTINEGSQLTLAGVFNDPDFDDIHTVTINWGDGVIDVISNDNISPRDANGNRSFANQRHTYQDDGQYTITVTVEDEGGLTATRTTSVAVNNVPPTITQGATLDLSIDEDNPTTFTLNATDPGRVDGLTWSILNQPANGTASVSMSPTGRIQTISYVPNANFAGMDTFEVQVADDDGGFDTIVVRVTVVPQPDSPDNFNITGDTDTLNEGGTFTLTGSFSDPDLGDSFTVTINWGDGSPATVIPNDSIVSLGNGNYTFTTSHVYRADSGAGQFSISAIVRDSANLTVSDTLSVRVLNVPPVITEGPTLVLSTPEDNPLTFTLNATDPADTVFQWNIVTGPSDGTLAFVTNPNGSGTQTLRYTPNANFDQLDGFQIRVGDGNGGFSIIDVVVNVEPINDAPTNLTLTPNLTTLNEGSTITLNGGFIDVDNLDTHTVTINWGDGNSIVLTETDLTQAGAQYTLPALNHVYVDEGNYTITVTVEDAEGATASRTQAITVNNVPPVIADAGGTPLGDTLTLPPGQEDTPITFGLSGIDPGITDVLQWSIVSGPSQGTVTILPPVAGEPQQFRYTPNPNVFGPDSFTIRLIDGDGGVDTVVVNLNLAPVNDLPVITANQFAITEGEPLLITQANLNATDVETFGPNLRFTISNLAPGERFAVQGGVDNFFTLADVIEGRVTFFNNGSETPPAFTITVEDDNAPPGSVTAPANITFTPVNDAPVIVNSSFAVTEGLTTVLSAANLRATDEESLDSGLVYTITTIAGGTIRVGGTVQTTFTQGDVDAGRVTFVHNGSETVPVLEFTVSDGDLSTAGTATIAYTPINDPPQMLVNTLTITEGQTLAITLQNINATDVDNDDNTLQFTVTGLNTSVGVFQRRNPTTGVFENASIFTRGDIVNGNVRFVHLGAEIAPAYTITVRDAAGLSASRVATVTFTTVNDAPVLVNNLLTIAEGEALVLTSANISATDEESGPAGLTFTVSGLENGQFEFVADPGVAITTFTQADINAGRVRFVHDGGEEAPAYTLTVSDGELSAGRAATIVFTNVNDAPTFIANTLTLTEGDTVVLTTANLNASDIETDANDLVFSIVEVRGGRFEFTDGTLIADAASGSVRTFTLEDIILNRVRFVQPPADHETVPFYRVAVTDNDPTNPQTTIGIAEVNFTPVNDPPVIVVNTLTIGEGGIALFSDGVSATTAGILRSADPETAPGLLTYTVSNVVGGRFERVDAPGTAITTFTQAQITARQVRFVQNGTSTAPNYTITVRDPQGLTATGTPTVTFTDVNDAPTITQNTLTITEGQTLVLSSDNIDATDEESGPDQLTYTVSGLAGGQFERVAAPGTAVTTFTQADINNGAIQFVHNGTETLPTYILTLSDSGGVTDTTLRTATSTVTVDFERVNDLPVFTVNTLTIAEGATVVLGNANLLASDEESTAAQLTYTVQNVANGRFERVAAPGTAITSFTQAQVTAGAIQFVHNGSEDAPTYTLIVTDSEGATATRAATITFTNVNDPPSFLASQLRVTEGATVIVTSDDLNAADPDHPADQIRYSVANVVGGEFRLSGTALAAGDTFTRVDIALGRVVFVDDGDGNAPTFDFVATDPAGDSTTITATVIFTPVNDPPQLVVNNFSIVEGGVLVLTTANLNATDEETPAAQLLYRVSNVVGGRFLNIDGDEITSFTQAQINAGNQIVFRHDGSEHNASNPGPSFTIEVLDPQGASSGPIAAVIDYTAVNDAPVFSRNILTISEGQTVVLSTTNIVVSDVDTPLSQLEFEIVTLANGFFTVNGTVLGVGDTFSRNDLVLGNVSFTASDDGLAPAYTLRVSDRDPTDPKTAERPATVFFTPVNDNPVITVNAFTITEGQDLILTSANLNATDEETTNPAQLVYTVSNVAGGTFFNLSTVSNVTTFTQQAVNDQTIVFRHNGSETPAAFTLTLRDPNSGQTTAAGNVTFIPVNDAPRITVNAFAIAEGQTLRLTALNLSATDPDNTPAQLTFTMTGITGGQFGRDTDGNGVPDELGITTFTQDEIGNGRIFFIHDGNEAAPTFTISVSDGALATAPAPGNIAFTPVNDPPGALNFAISATTIDEGDSITLTGTFTDPDSTTHTVTIAWGDGTTTTIPSTAIVNNGGGNFSLPATTKTYADDGDFEISITVNDGTDSTTLDTPLAITVEDVPPTVALTGTAGPLRAGQLYTLTIGEPVDPGDDTITSYRISWGDGTITTVTAPGDVTKVYKTPGDYTISVRVSENSGLTFDVGTVSTTMLYPITDFTGDGNADLFWRINGTNTIWALNADGTFANGLPLRPLDRNFTVQTVADFNNDGKSDIFWRNANTGTTGIWLMDGATVTDSRVLPNLSSAWSAGGFADFNNDGNLDVLWRNANGSNAIWLLNDGVLQQGVTLNSLDPAFSVAAISDFNNNGFDDILWRNPSTGQNLVWLMNGPTFTGQTLNLQATPNPSLTVAGVDDFNGDGIEDLLWRNTSNGNNTLWLMSNNGVLNTAVPLPNVAVGFEMRGISDLNGDGNPDVVWRNGTTGETFAWAMNGSTVGSTIDLPDPQPGWQVYV